MSWNSTLIDGTQPVAANKSRLNTNNNYIETTLNNDHYWNIGANEDGRHQFVNMPDNAGDATIATGMNGVLYVNATTEDRKELWYRNSDGIYQLSPSFLSGTHVVTGSYTNMVAVPANVYGEIFMFRSGVTGNKTFQAGAFHTTGTTCEAWPYAQRNSGSSDAVFNVRFGNGGNASGLNIRVRTGEASSGNTWTYRVIYRDI